MPVDDENRPKLELAVAELEKAWGSYRKLKRNGFGDLIWHWVEEAVNLGTKKRAKLAYLYVGQDGPKSSVSELMRLGKTKNEVKWNDRMRRDAAVDFYT